MKLGIIIPLKSKKVAKNWELTLSNLLNTINSIESQTDQNFSAIIVGHELPEYLYNKKAISSNIQTIVLEELDPPNETNDKKKNQLLYEKDRCSKILKGIITLKNQEPTINYWFPLDADDLIHRDFIKKLKQLNPNDNLDAFVLNKGYFYYQSSNTFISENNFSLWCGSSTIIADRNLPLPSQITNTSYQEFLFGQVPHSEMLNTMKARSFSISVPHDRLVTYCKDHGENISDEVRPNSFAYTLKRNLKIKIRKIYFTKKIKKDFFSQGTSE